MTLRTVALALLIASAAFAGPGDVLDEFKISALSGGLMNGPLPGDQFGCAIAPLGDLNGDGYPDLVVGALEDDGRVGGNARGAVWILFLDEDGRVAGRRKIGDFSGGFPGTLLDDVDQFGAGVDVIGDLDDDGVVDLAVGARHDDDGGTDRGAVWILFLNRDGTVKTYQKISATEGGFTGDVGDGDLFGSSVASLGDLDGDGITDIAVGAIRDDDSPFDLLDDLGAVWILFLNADGTVKGHSKISATEGGFDGEFEDETAWFGNDITAIGDNDGDGVTDIAVGVPFDTIDDVWTVGSVWVIHLNTDGSVKHETRITTEEGGFAAVLDDDHFGTSISHLGDLDCDGIGDLAIGAVSDDGGGDGRGAVWVCFLNADGTVKSHRRISDGEGGFGGALNDGDGFGGAISPLGDIDGNGVVDIAVGASGDDDGGSLTGAVWLLNLDGAPLDLSSPLDGDNWPVGSLRTVTWCGVGPVDLSLSVDGGRTYDRLESALAGNAYTVRVPNAPTRFARIRVESVGRTFSSAASDSFFTIDASIALSRFEARPAASGVTLSWMTEPGPDDLAGYRLERSTATGWTTLEDLTGETTYVDPSGHGHRYRLTAINGLGGERVLRETTVITGLALTAGPLPYRSGVLTITFSATRDAALTLHDVAGRTLRRFDRLSGGTLAWDGLDSDGQLVPTGTCFLRLDDGSEVRTMKIAVLR